MYNLDGDKVPDDVARIAEERGLEIRVKVCYEDDEGLYDYEVLYWIHKETDEAIYELVYTYDELYDQLRTNP